MSAKSPGAPIRARTTGCVTTVQLTGDQVVIDEASTPALSGQLFDVARVVGPGQLVLDFANVSYLSTLLLATLVRLHRVLQTAGGRLSLRNLPPEVYKVFEVTRLTALLDIQQGEPGTQRDIFPKEDERC